MNLIIDISNALYRSFFVYKKMYSDLEKINQQLFFSKFKEDFQSTLNLFDNVERVICCFDSENYFRKDYYFNYKSNREKQEEGFYKVRDYIEKFFIEQDNFIVSKIELLEADDCIAFWSKHFDQHNQICVIVSADEDIRQLLSNNIFAFNNDFKNKKFYVSSIHDKKNVVYVQPKDSSLIYENPNTILMNKMLLGCKGDCVPRLLERGIGEVTLNKKLISHISFDRKDISSKIINYIIDEVKNKLNNKLLFDDLLLNLALVDLNNLYQYIDKNIEDECEKHIQDNKNKISYDVKTSLI